MQRNIKRTIIEEDFDDPDLGKIIIERFRGTAQLKFE